MYFNAIIQHAPKGKPPTVWDGSGDDFEYTKVLQTMREILAGDEAYHYLHPSAANRLREIRLMVRQTRLLENEVFEISPDTFGLALWLGTRASNDLDFALNALLPSRQYVPHAWPFLLVKNVTRPDLTKAMAHLRTNPISVEELRLPDDVTVQGKYSDFVPPALLKKQYLDRFVDVEELQRMLSVSG